MATREMQLETFAQELAQELGRERERHTQTTRQLHVARDAKKALTKRHSALKSKYTRLLSIVKKALSQQQQLPKGTSAVLTSTLAEQLPTLTGSVTKSHTVPTAPLQPLLHLPQFKAPPKAQSLLVKPKAAPPKAHAPHVKSTAVPPPAAQQPPLSMERKAQPLSHCQGTCVANPDALPKSSPHQPPTLPIPVTVPGAVASSQRPRSELPAHTCRSCEAFFAATGMHVDCEHVQAAGRHRRAVQVASTPPSFWGMAFSDGDGVVSPVQDEALPVFNPRAEHVAVDKEWLGSQQWRTFARRQER